MNLAASLELQARLARRAVRRISQLARYRQLTFSGVPVLFANSFPKSGTHLLTQVLHGFIELGPAVDSGLPAIVTYAGDSGEPRPLTAIKADVQRLRPGDVAYGHLHAHPQIVDLLDREGMANYFILRDPRDVVVSHVHYVTEMAPRHAHHDYYQELENYEAQLRTSILGRPDWMHPFPDIRARFEPYLGWLESPGTLVIHFEDLVEHRDDALVLILGHAVGRGFPIEVDREHAVAVLARSIDPQRSPTFRAGRVGAWKDRFTPEITRLFKEVAGDLLVALGYEMGYDW